MNINIILNKITRISEYEKWNYSKLSKEELDFFHKWLGEAPVRECFKYVGYTFNPEKAKEARQELRKLKLKNIERIFKNNLVD